MDDSAWSDLRVKRPPRRPPRYDEAVARLERFRRYGASMDPTSPLDEEGGRALYVEPPDALVDSICAKLELRPTSRLLLVGCTGSGKTTLIRRCVERVRQTVEVVREYATYLDVSRYHQMDSEGLEGVLVALAGKHLVDRARYHL